MTVPAEHRAFASRIAETKAQDPMPTFVVLAETTGIPRKREDWDRVAGIIDWLAAGG